jgi:GTPase SAR1 family protein
LLFNLIQKGMFGVYPPLYRSPIMISITHLEATSSNVYIAAGNINTNSTPSGKLQILPPFPSVQLTVGRLFVDRTSLQRFNDAPTDFHSTHFTGRRKELELLQETLKAPACTVPARCVVYGMPGIGKTSLVLQYATESFDQGWYSQVLWMSGTTVEKLNKGMTKILDLIEHPERHRTEQDAKLTAARRWLEGSHHDDTIRWLLIIDNVDRSSLEFIRQHLPRRSAQGSILITTRTADVADALVDVTTRSHRKIEIHVPDMIDATRLFFSNAGIDSKDTTSTQTSQAKDLIEAVGSVPLAIVHAATYKKQTQTSLQDILQLYRSEHKGEVRLSMQPNYMEFIQPTRCFDGRTI